MADAGAQDHDDFGSIRSEVINVIDSFKCERDARGKPVPTLPHPALAMVGKPLVIGIGNPDRGDDAVGLIVAQHLTLRCPAGVRIVEHSGESTSLLDCLGSADCAFVVDACMAGRPPGTIDRFDVAATELPAIAFACSTHGMGVADAIELARALGRLPRHCVVYAIEGRSYDIGAALSPDVAAAARSVADLIRNELQNVLNDQDAAAQPVHREQI